jgi:AraC-like DNA-binding protein
VLGPSRGFEWQKSLAREHISDYRLVRVLEYIEAHLSDRLDLRVLSTEAGISPFHFAALFTKAVGATPHQHVQHLRLEAAKAMLRDTDKSTLDIALTCGFASASHLAATFRRQFSQSPTEYRSTRRAVASDPTNLETMTRSNPMAEGFVEVNGIEVVRANERGGQPPSVEALFQTSLVGLAGKE